jgi:large repetitive protein
VVLVLDKPGMGIADVTKDTLAFGVYLPNTLDENNFGQDPDRNWTTNFELNQTKYGLFNVQDIEDITKYDFFSNIPSEIQEAIEDTDVSKVRGKINNIQPAFLLAEEEKLPFTPIGSLFDSSIRHNGVPNQVTRTTNTRFMEVGVGEISTSQNSIFKTADFGVVEECPRSIYPTQPSQSQVSTNKNSSNTACRSEVGVSQDGIGQISPSQTSTKQIGFTQINSFQNSTSQVGSTEIDSPQIITSKSIDSFGAISPIVVEDELDSSEISFSRVVPSQQFISSDLPNHNSTPKITNVLNNSATKIWSDLLQLQTSLDVDFQITDLPKGQLAEATITGFDDSGKPNAGTILIDSDANGVGWFVDSTPLDNSEFGVISSENYLLAAAESEASGKYDLLTTVLHELSHLYGFIDGYQGFSDNIETKNGNTKFIGDDFTATLDGEHLDKQAHPYDLLNTHLAPGMRKLPSEFDVQILQAILADNDGETRRQGDGENLEAALTSDPLLAISNGDFSIADTTSNTFAWDIRGDSGIENAQAVLTEDSPFQSNFTQTFTVPEAAKTIQFKLVETELGASELAPPDAFEVALLDADTQESLTTETGLTETDSLLNIQPDGTAHFSDRVRIGGATSGEIINLDKSRTVTIDISDLTPGTEATLYFDLIGLRRCR